MNNARSAGLCDRRHVVYKDIYPKSCYDFFGVSSMILGVPLSRTTLVPSEQSRYYAICDKPEIITLNLQLEQVSVFSDLMPSHRLATPSSCFRLCERIKFTC